MRAVYPRWRGEHACQRLFKPAAERFIPAGAGNTNFLNLFFSRNSVYPRWRGEHWQRAITTVSRSGLSPLARGTRRIAIAYPGKVGFIPAGAGNTVVGGSGSSRAPVYPRWRGEHIRWGVFALTICGLSPLARGTQIQDQYFDIYNRFIPAGAGNTTASNKRHARIAVYPRWRGEHTKHT